MSKFTFALLTIGLCFSATFVKAQETKTVKKVIIVTTDASGKETSKEITITNKNDDGKIIQINKGDGEIKEINISNLDELKNLDIEIPEIGKLMKDCKKSCHGMNLHAAEPKARIGVILNLDNKVTTEGDKAESKSTITIDEVVKNAPAEKAGLKSGDIITKVDNKAMNDINEFTDLIGNHNPGDIVQVTYTRNGESRTVAITLDAPKPFVDENRPTFVYKKNLNQPATPEGAEACEKLNKLSLRPFLGVILNDDASIHIVLEKTAAEKAGLKVGDRIRAINNTDIDNMDELVSTLATYKPGDKITIEYRRENTKTTVDAVLGNMTENPSDQMADLKAACDRHNKATTAPLLELKNFSVFPNPGNGVMTLKFDSDNKGVIEISVSDTNGKEVWKTTLPETSNSYNGTVDISAMPKGAYILSVRQGDKVRSEKIVLQ